MRGSKDGLRRLFLRSLATVILAAAGCERPDPSVTVIGSSFATIVPEAPPITPGNEVSRVLVTPESPATESRPLPTRVTYGAIPTPDLPHPAAGGADGGLFPHTVRAGETLGYLAQVYDSSVEELQNINELETTELVYVGQQILIPDRAGVTGPDFKIIPDSELVRGPAAFDFDVRNFVSYFGGRLLSYGEEVEGHWLEGPEIVDLIANRYSVNPRLLLTALEYGSGWVTRPAGADTLYPLGHRDERFQGLYRQLSWAADELNWGFYGRAEAGITSILVTDNTRVNFAPPINHGSAAVQRLLARRSDTTYEQWLQDVAPDGFFSTYDRLFGNPFGFGVEPLWPGDLTQPAWLLPWSDGETWYLTGGPHGGWAAGSAWAALDFAPTGDVLGCVQTDAWVTAVADGIVTRSDFGAVVVDLDGDGYAGTGWAITYMHLESRDRAPAGTFVQAGDRLGHPSCEGGFSDGTHLHLARTYNGRWVAADREIPFVLGGWVSEGTGREYDGFLARGGVRKEACACREANNEITAD